LDKNAAITFQQCFHHSGLHYRALAVDVNRNRQASLYAIKLDSPLFLVPLNGCAAEPQAVDIILAVANLS